MEYTVHKNKATRISYRITGIVFLLLAITAIVFAFIRVGSLRVLVAIFSSIGMFYGIYLVKMSFRKQAYDITYQFSEEGILLKYHKGEETLTYDRIIDVSLIEPDPDIAYSIVQIKTEKEQLVLHFVDKDTYANKIFEYLNCRIVRKQQ